jgi:hypothetical protein
MAGTASSDIASAMMVGLVLFIIEYNILIGLIR